MQKKKKDASAIICCFALLSYIQLKLCLSTASQVRVFSCNNEDGDQILKRY